MKILTALLASTLMLTFAADADAASRKRTRYSDGYERSYAQRYARSNTVAQNGLCQRDTGTHNSQLSFRNRCDIEEFWARQERYGGRR